MEIDVELLENTYNYCKMVAEFTGVLNDTIRLEVDAELREDQMQPNEDQKNKLSSLVSKMYSSIRSRFTRE